MRLPVVALAAAGFLVGSGSGARADDLQVSLKDGRVTIVADQVPVRRILEEWARLGQVRVVNLEKLSAPAVTLRLIDVPESHALDVLLRSAAGYLAASRAAAEPGVSRFDRVVILATSRPPATAPAPTALSPAAPAFAPRNVPFPPPAGVSPADPGGQDPEVTVPGVLPPPVTPFPRTGGDARVPPEEAPPMTAPQPGVLPGAPAQQPPAPVLLPQPGFPPPTPAPKKPGGGGLR